MKFEMFQRAVQAQFKKMAKHPLYRVQVEKDLLWETYLKSFPEGTNPIYKERTEHDCNCCKSFVRAVGNMVAIIDGKKVSLWDCTVGGFYQEVADALAELVKSKPIENVFLHTEPKAGAIKTHQLTENGKTLTWYHFAIEIPAAYRCAGADIGTKLADARSTFDVMLRGMSEITIDAIDTVLELIGQNSIYRGQEHKFAITEFRKLRKKFDTAADKELFCWEGLKSDSVQSVLRIRNTLVGTLLVDVSEGMDLNHAVSRFEHKAYNYKRSTALVTKSQVEAAHKALSDLGYLTALDRRYAVIEDLTINNVLFADRSAKKAMNVFDEIAASSTKPVQHLDKAEEITIDQFIKNVLPTADSLELLVENRHERNLVSLIAPADLTAKSMFKWHNNFSWAYIGDVADSVKERVKKAGGRTEGYACFRLGWFNFDDLDAHMTEPGGYEIYYGNRTQSSPCGGMLDVDMNAGSGQTRTPVENIVYSNKKRMKPGIYTYFIHNFRKRESDNVGFEVEMEIDGVLHNFAYAKPLRDGEKVQVVKFKYSVDKGIEIIESLKSSLASRQIWNIPTQQFCKVSTVMFSPNYWDEKATGNQHYFFMLEGCVSDERARGFFNEYLLEDLFKHRKVFEILGTKMKVEESPNQLSGLGFSSTQKNSIICKVTGKFTRTIKIVF